MVRIGHNFEVGAFEWLWAKYVRGGNPTQHCFVCLKGTQSRKFSKAFNPDMDKQRVMEMDEKAEGEYDAIYFCGVSKKGYDYNVHLVVRPQQGASCVWESKPWRVEIENGVIDSIPCAGELKPEFFSAPYDHHFYTCRNFLWMMSRYYPETIATDKQVIRCVKDYDGTYDTDRAIPITIDEWRVILRDMAEKDAQSWNLLREFHKAKGHTAYVRDVEKVFGMTTSGLIKRIDDLGLLVGGRHGGFRIVRGGNPRSECWWPVFFHMRQEGGPENTVYTLRRDIVKVMDEMTKAKAKSTSVSAIREGKGTVGYPTFYFFEMGLNVGDVLTFTENPNITATVATNRKVICNGKETYLTPLTNELRGKSSRMGKYWTFNGKTIDELYYDTYFPDGKTFAEYQAEVEAQRKG